MPLDPNIPLSVRPPNITFDAMGMLSDLQRVRRQDQEDADRAQARQFQLRDLADERKIRDVLLKTRNPETGEIDFDTAAREVSLIDPLKADALRQQGRQRQAGALSDVVGRINEQKTFYGQGAALLQAIEQNPALYPQLRPKLIDMASAIDPRLASEIPEQYNPGQVRGMLQFAQDGAATLESRAHALKLHEEAEKAQRGSREEFEAQKKALEAMLSTAKTQEQWEAFKGLALQAGYNKQLVHQYTEWSPEAAKVTFQAPTEALVRGKVDFVQRGSDGGWYDMDGKRLPSSSVRPKPEKASGGSARTVSPAQKATAERWLQSRLASIEREFGDPESGMTTTQLNERKLEALNSYRSQIGLEAVAELPPEWRGKASPADAPAPPPSTPVPPIAPVTSSPRGGGPAMATQLKVGDSKRLRDGRTVKVTKVYADGSFDVE